MTPKELENLILQKYGAAPEYLWSSSPNTAIYRRADNNRWFALITKLDPVKLKLKDGEFINILNVKCDPGLIGSLLAQKGFFKAYHMNKENWVSVSIKEVSDIQTEHLIETSFNLTGKK